MAVQVTSDLTPSIAPGTAIGRVLLTVPSLDRSRVFYERLLGMSASKEPDGSLLLGAAAGLPPLLSLVGDSAAPPHNARQTGLFHFAILVPTRRDLAVALVRLVQGGWRLGGASDHLVSEALYMSDPDGNGIEIYHDRDRSTWGRDADGQIAMATLPLDIEDLLGELDRAPVDAETDALLPADTRIGHMHLQVAELEQVGPFYSGVLGFDVMARSYPGALFVSAGGYHHHIGLNTWNSRGGATPPAGAVGLRAYEIKLPDAQALAEVLARVEAAGVATEPAVVGATLVRDPSGNGILLTA
ncbi:MAG TPA: VOC family protein [Solirubrobacteraceae bacterium]|jgi:catechol 2,3-dioxygenase|nr:VOC family protein [Solirubrobacteraceae bacterium]